MIKRVWNCAIVSDHPACIKISDSTNEGNNSWICLRYFIIFESAMSVSIKYVNTKKS